MLGRLRAQNNTSWLESEQVGDTEPQNMAAPLPTRW